ncbi:MAG: hypothetical protein KC643_16325 [Nitrospira sp.]|nr:hypothetical protein [Nitrospira sp.]
MTITGTISGIADELHIALSLALNPALRQAPSLIKWVFYIDTIHVLDDHNEIEETLTLTEMTMKPLLEADVNSYFFGNPLEATEEPSKPSDLQQEPLQVLPKLRVPPVAPLEDRR